MILVTGATGHNGREVVRLIAERGDAVRAMLHDLKKADQLPEGVEPVQAEFSDPASLLRALAGVSHAFLVTPPRPDSVQWETDFINAAREAQVTHIVKLSVLSADPNSPSRFHRMHGESEKVLEASGMLWTHLRANLFMETVPQYAVGGQMFNLCGDSKISVVSIHDIAAVAVIALTQAGHAGKALNMTGPEALSYPEMAKQLSAATGQPLEIVPLTREQATQSMDAQGFAPWNRDGVLELNEWFATGEAATVSNAIERITRRPPHSFAQFAKDYAALHRGG